VCNRQPARRIIDHRRPSNPSHPSGVQLAFSIYCTPCVSNAAFQAEAHSCFRCFHLARLSADCRSQCHQPLDAGTHELQQPIQNQARSLSKERDIGWHFAVRTIIRWKVSTTSRSVWTSFPAEMCLDRLKFTFCNYEMTFLAPGLNLVPLTVERTCSFFSRVQSTVFIPSYVLDF
jgi:hypothetical protein